VQPTHLARLCLATAGSLSPILALNRGRDASHFDLFRRKRMVSPRLRGKQAGQTSCIMTHPPSLSLRPFALDALARILPRAPRCRHGPSPGRKALEPTGIRRPCYRP
jgi:hypothetical protein